MTVVEDGETMPLVNPLELSTQRIVVRLVKAALTVLNLVAGGRLVREVEILAVKGRRRAQVVFCPG